MSKKLFALLIIIVVVLIGAYFAWNHYKASGTNPRQVASTSPQTEGVTYQNNQYGFSFALFEDWSGYSIVAETWTGYPNQQQTTVSGPEILIRNPAWSTTTPTQDIPIMIFTPDQWSQVTNGEMSVSAAPIPPTKLGENANYVFALPARYNYAYPQGWQEVQTIMDSDPLKAF